MRAWAQLAAINRNQFFVGRSRRPRQGMIEGSAPGRQALREALRIAAARCQMAMAISTVMVSDPLTDAC